MMLNVRNGNGNVCKIGWNVKKSIKYIHPKSSKVMNVLCSRHVQSDFVPSSPILLSEYDVECEKWKWKWNVCENWMECKKINKIHTSQIE